jgi:maleate isomerase
LVLPKSPGHRMKRIGLIIPSSNRMVEAEMLRALPAGVSGHVARLRMTGPYAVPLERLAPEVTAAAATLADAHCDAIAFHCTANSTAEGSSGEALLLEALRAGSPDGAVTSTATAIRAALQALAARRIALVTPYSPATTAHEAEFFHAAGYDVVTMVARDLSGSDAYCSAPPATWEAALQESRRDEIDVYVLSCANISCFPIIDRAEAALGKPIVTSNQSVLWETLRAAAAPRPSGLGRLMTLS